MSARDGPILRARFLIKQLPDVERKPFYIYRYAVKDSQRKAVDHSTSDDVTSKVMDQFIENQKPESSLYFKDESQLYTQFPISADKLSQIFQKLFTNMPPSWKIDLVGDSGIKTYVQLELELLYGPVDDLDSFDVSSDHETHLKRSFLAMIRADHGGSEFQSDDSITVRDFDQDVHQRATNLGNIIRHDWGLRVSAHRPSTHKYQLICREDDYYLLNSINLVDLLKKQLRSWQLTSQSDIKEKMKSLVGIEVVVKLKKETNQEGSEDYVTVSDEIYKIRGVGARSMETDYFLQRVDGEKNKLVKLMSAEQMFEQEFPGQELQHKYLPCLVVSGGKFLPMEFCWITPVRLQGDEKVMEFRNEHAATWPTIAERQQIFSDNCNSLCRRSTTLNKFGYSLKLAMAYQSCSL